ncbi:MFS transporter [Mesorhizobium sp. BAC0120]|uniref:MFS transporter n=1 Tax=Mesorhizobium sp. BAC0120 TaxID=3090670 RepID=UPI00298D314C|nr:MFS transporter [Mesorhizobium sp. BAC0120]MDW6022408.1 MFS transporter [Mesorhizobium sp. BAC0120]
MDGRLIWLATGAFSTSMVAFVFAGLLPLISVSAKVSISEAGHLVTAYSLAYAIGTPILATLTGAADRKRVIAGALLLFLIGNATAAASNSFVMLTAAQIIMGAAAGLYASTAQATAVMLAGVEHRAKAVATVVGGTTIAVALGAPLGSLIGNIAGWRASFLFVGLVALLCAGALSLRLPRGLPGVKLTLAERVLTIAKPGVLPALIVTYLYLTGAFVVICYMAPLATDGAGMPVTMVPAMMLAFGIGAVVGNYLSGRLSDRLGATRVVVFSLTAASTICIIVSLILKLLPSTIAGPLLIAVMVPWGIVGWTFPPAQASRLVALAPELTNLTLPLNMSAMYFGIASGSFLGGQVLKHAPASELGMVAAVFPLIALVALYAHARLRKPALAAGE